MPNKEQLLLHALTVAIEAAADCLSLRMTIMLCLASLVGPQLRDIILRSSMWLSVACPLITDRLSPIHVLSYTYVPRHFCLFLSPWLDCMLSCLQVDAAGFEAEMQVQRQRSKDSARTVDLSTGSVLGDLASEFGATQSLFHTHNSSHSHIVALIKDGQRVESASAGELADGAIAGRLMLCQLLSKCPEASSSIPCFEAQICAF